MPAANATLDEGDGRPTPRFERMLHHSPELVWRALTELDAESAWHLTPARFEPRAGGRVEYVESGHGCLLILIHRFDDRLKAARDGAGWHVCPDSLASALDGAIDPPAHGPDIRVPGKRLTANTISASASRPRRRRRRGGGSEAETI